MASGDDITRHGMDYGDIEDAIVSAFEDDTTTNQVTVVTWSKKNGKKYVAVDIGLGKTTRRTIHGVKFQVNNLSLFSETVDGKISDHWVKVWAGMWQDTDHLLTFKNYTASQ